MTRAALIGLTVLFTAPALLLAGAILGWLSRDREDNAELGRMRKVAAEADAILAAIQADPPKTVIPAQRYKLSCGRCGLLEVSSDLIPVPVTDEDFATALDVLLTEHAIAAHLDEVAS